MLLRRWGVGSTVSLTLPRRVAKFCLLRIISLGWMYTCRHAILLVLEDVRLLAKSCCFGGGASGRRSLLLYPGGSPSFVCFESIFCSRGLYGANRKPLLESTARRQQGPIGSNSETFIREHSMCWMCTYRHAILLVLEDVRLLAKSCCFGGGASGRRSLLLYPGGLLGFVCFEPFLCVGCAHVDMLFSWCWRM